MVSERDYSTGYQAACRSMLQHISGHLGKAAKAAEMKLELATTRAALRRLCIELGCSDWNDSLHLEDVIEKHLRPRVAELLELELESMDHEQRVATEMGR